MKNNKILSKELLAADAALRRAALKVKQDSERLGTPYVVFSAHNVNVKTDEKNK